MSNIILAYILISIVVVLSLLILIGLYFKIMSIYYEYRIKKHKQKLADDEWLKWQESIFSNPLPPDRKHSISVGVNFLKAIYKEKGKEGLVYFLSTCFVYTDNKGTEYLNSLGIQNDYEIKLSL